MGQLQLSGAAPRLATAVQAEITLASLMVPEWTTTRNRRGVSVTRNVLLWAIAASIIHRRVQVISPQNMLPSNF